MFLLVLTVHVLTLTVFVGTAVMIDLRLLGLTMSRVPVSEVLARLLPWMGAGFLVMMISGMLILFGLGIMATSLQFRRFHRQSSSRFINWIIRY